MAPVSTSASTRSSHACSCSGVQKRLESMNVDCAP
jgi:hypothetical protein